MNDLELFNAHQEDTRKRTEFLAKSVFLISGAALTLSINLFLGKEAPLLSSCLAGLLRFGWAALFLSIVGYVLAISIMMIRDYRFGERWRRSLHGSKEDVTGSPGALDALMWILGTLSILCLLTGLGVLAWVSVSLVGFQETTL